MPLPQLVLANRVFSTLKAAKGAYADYQRLPEERKQALKDEARELQSLVGVVALRAKDLGLDRIRSKDGVPTTEAKPVQVGEEAERSMTDLVTELATRTAALKAGLSAEGSTSKKGKLIARGLGRMAAKQAASAGRTPASTPKSPPPPAPGLVPDATLAPPAAFAEGAGQAPPPPPPAAPAAAAEPDDAASIDAAMWATVN